MPATACRTIASKSSKSDLTTLEATITALIKMEQVAHTRWTVVVDVKVSTVTMVGTSGGRMLAASVLGRTPWGKPGLIPWMGE